MYFAILYIYTYAQFYIHTYLSYVLDMKCTFLKFLPLIAIWHDLTFEGIENFS